MCSYSLGVAAAVIALISTHADSAASPAVVLVAPWAVPVHWIAPPPPRLVIAPPPRAGWIWSPGYWRWTGRSYFWVEGAWLPARRGFAFVPAHWRRTPDGWIFMPAKWLARPL